MDMPRKYVKRISTQVGSLYTYTSMPIRNLSSVSLVFFEEERVTGRAGHRLSSSLILAFTFV